MNDGWKSQWWAKIRRAIGWAERYNKTLTLAALSLTLIATGLIFWQGEKTARRSIAMMALTQRPILAYSSDGPPSIYNITKKRLEVPFVNKGTLMAFRVVTRVRISKEKVFNDTLQLPAKVSTDCPPQAVFFAQASFDTSLAQTEEVYCHIFISYTSSSVAGDLNAAYYTYMATILLNPKADSLMRPMLNEGGIDSVAVTLKPLGSWEEVSLNDPLNAEKLILHFSPPSKPWFD